MQNLKPAREPQNQSASETESQKARAPKSQTTTAPETQRARQPPRTSQFTSQTARQTDRQPATTVRHNSQAFRLMVRSSSSPSFAFETYRTPNTTALRAFRINMFKSEQNSEHVQNRTKDRTRSKSNTEQNTEHEQPFLNNRTVFRANPDPCVSMVCCQCIKSSMTTFEKTNIFCEITFYIVLVRNCR